MSGTPSEEVNYLYNKDILNFIKVNSKVKHNKVANFVLCSDNESKNTHLLNKLVSNINKGIKNIVITDKGENYSKPMIATIERILNRPIKTSYFKRSLKDDKVNNDIMFNATFDNSLEVLFGSSYLSVGVDIENENEHFNVFFPNNEHTAEDIEQFNNRLRKTNIEAYIYDVVLNAKGEVKDYEEEYKAILNQRYTITEQDKEDDKKIAESKEVDKKDIMLTNSPIAHRMNTFKDVELSESKKCINEYMFIHTAKQNIGYIYEQLSSKYQYTVNKIDYDGENSVYSDYLSETRSELKDMNKQILKKAIIESYAINVLNDIKVKNIVFKDIDSIMVEGDFLYVNIEYRDFYKVIFSTIKMLKNYYSLETVKGLLNTYNTKASMKKLNKLITLEQTNQSELSEQDKVLRKALYNAINNNNIISFIPDNYTNNMRSGDAKILSTNKYNEFIDSICVDIAENTLNLNANNKIHVNDLRKRIVECFDSMFNKRRHKGVIYAELITIPKSDTMTEEQEIDNNVSEFLGSGIVDNNSSSLNKITNKTVTKRLKQRLVKRLLKAYLKVEVLPTETKTVKAIKDAYMDETGEVLTKKVFIDEYREIYNINSKRQITGLK